jgi:hypothetical protein
MGKISSRFLTLVATEDPGNPSAQLCQFSDLMSIG